MLSYYEVCQKIQQGWRVERNDEQKIPYAYSNNEWVGYDDPESLRAKVQFIKQKDVAGAMFWALDFDDFNGQFCNQGKYPLVNAVKNALKGSGGFNPPPVIPTFRPTFRPSSNTQIFIRPTRPTRFTNRPIFTQPTIRPLTTTKAINIIDEREFNERPRPSKQ